MDAARILVVEDDDAIRKLLVTALGVHGYEVLEASDGGAGLDVARDERPDLILLDLGLPALHGSAVLERLKAEPATMGGPVIVVSAWGEEVTTRMVLSAGAVAMVRKPFDVAHLLET